MSGAPEVNGKARHLIEMVLEPEQGSLPLRVKNKMSPEVHRTVLFSSESTRRVMGYISSLEK